MKIIYYYYCYYCPFNVRVSPSTGVGQIILNMLKISHLRYILLFEICTSEVCEKFVYKHSETTEYEKNQPTFKKFTNFTGE